MLQPVLSLNYVLTVVLAALVLKEEVTLLRMTGILCVMGGVLLICGGDGEGGENESPPGFDHDADRAPSPL